jgi:putative transposase
MRKTFKFKVYPNKNREVRLNRTLTTCRYLDNNSLAERKKQAELNRLKKRSINRNKQKIITTKVHKKIRNQRTDFAHKQLRKLVNSYDHIVFEDLQIQNMLKNHRLEKPISDAGRSQLINLAKSKAEYAGKLVELVNSKGTSQLCICGFSAPEDLSVRANRSQKCVLIIHRNHITAIIVESRSTIGTMGIKARQGLLSRGSMQREASQLLREICSQRRIKYD